MLLIGVLQLLLVPTAALSGTTTYAGFIVCIDPGHQAASNNSLEPLGPGSSITKPCVSSGTSGTLSGTEHSVVLDVGLRLRTLLEAEGINVVMTRTTANVDICNSTRAQIANDAQANLFIRLHCNSGTTSGCFMLHPALITGWTDDIHSESLKAAQLVQAAYSQHTGLFNKGLFPRDDLTGFNFADVPAILPEMLEMKNASDDAAAASATFRQEMAEGLAIGIFAYLDTLPPPTLPALGWELY